MPVSIPPPTPSAAGRRRSDLDRRLDAEWFKALSDPTRARLLACLIKCGRPCSVSEIAACCAVDFSVVARHLGRLAEAGFLSARKEGRVMWYAADGPGLADAFRALADAVAEWTPGPAGADGEPCGSGCPC